MGFGLSILCNSLTQPVQIAIFRKSRLVMKFLNQFVLILKKPHQLASIILFIGIFTSLSVSALPASTKRDWRNTDFENRVVDLDEIQSGGVPKDGIPSIDDPQFVSVDQATKWLSENEPVIVLEIFGKAKAYPLQILIWHEIVNDELSSRFVSVTFCPLCNASIVFDRNKDGEILEFGTTGHLRNSDLVMYDRQTESWWQQITGRGIVGSYAGSKLFRLPSQITSFKEFAKAYPEGEVLSRDTGYSREYGRNPYRGYDDINNSPFFGVDLDDVRLAPMERVLNVTVNDRHRVYPFSSFEHEPVINDKFNGVPLVVFSKPDAASALDGANISQSRIIPSATAYRREIDAQILSFVKVGDSFFDQETGSEWNLFGKAIQGPLAGKELENIDSGLHFAFAWLVFYPKSEIYSNP